MRSKIQTLSDELNENFKEREDEIAGSLLAMISGEHVLFIGPPGTAKSLLAREMCKAIEEGNFFYYLLTRFTTPDEIFGPLSLSSLQEDVFSRKIEGYLPTANVSFLDEIFKANSSILNSLLTILNERKYHNGSELVTVPLYSVFGASNELPEENESLEALYDRFLFRYYVGYVQDETNFLDLILGHAENFAPSTKLNIAELDVLQERAEAVPVGEDVLDALVGLRKEFRSMGVSVSDRRWKKFVRVLRVAAAALDRENVDKTMLPLLQHMTWNKPEEKATIRKLLLEMTVSGGVDLERTKKDLQDLHASAALSRNYILPEKVTCYSCEREFTDWNSLREHGHNSPDHIYVLTGKEEKYQLTRNRTTPKMYPNFLDYFESKGRPVVRALDEDKKALYLQEVEDLEDDLGLLETDLEKERAELHKALAENIWLSHRDREDIMSIYDGKAAVMGEMRSLLGDTRDIVTTEERVE